MNNSSASTPISSKMCAIFSRRFILISMKYTTYQEYIAYSDLVCYQAATAFERIQCNKAISANA